MWTTIVWYIIAAFGIVFIGVCICDGLYEIANTMQPWKRTADAKKKKVTAIIEKNADGRYSCIVTESFGNYGIAGYGESAEEARDDMLECYREMKELNAKEGIPTPSLTFTYIW